MFLTAYNLAHYLLARGKLDLQDVIDGDLAIAEAGRRNRNFKVLRRRAEGLFVKQIKSTEAQAISTIQREASFYRTVHSHPAFTRLRSLMPAFIDYDDRRYAIALSLADNSETINDRQMRERTYSRELASVLGRALAVIHSHAAPVLADPATRSLFTYQPAWPLTLQPGGDQMIQGLGPVGPALLSGLRRFPSLIPLLGALRTEWRYDSLIHNDMKWDNCLVRIDAGINAGGEPQLTIVDWEMADIGDGAWDVASILKEYVIAILMNSEAARTPVPQGYPAPAPIPVDTLPESVQAFWSAYSSARGFSALEAQTTLLRAMRLTAGRMIVGVLEFFPASNELGAFGNLMLQASAGILEAPQVAISQLFGSAPVTAPPTPPLKEAFAAA